MFSVESFICLFIFLLIFVCFPKNVILCLFTVCRSEASACTKVRLGLEVRGNVRSYVSPTQAPAAARGRKAPLSYTPHPPFSSWFTLLWRVKLLSPVRLLSTVFACEAGERGNTLVGAARGRKAALSETLVVVVASHRGPVVERRATNRPTNTKNLMKASHTNWKKTMLAEYILLKSSITHTQLDNHHSLEVSFNKTRFATNYQSECKWWSQHCIGSWKSLW